MTVAGGGTFMLSAFDYAEFVQGGHAANANRIDVIGNLSGGGTISQTVLIDGINDGPGGGVDFQSVILNALFQTSVLSSVQFFGFDNADVRRGFQLDNLVVNAQVAVVPVPGTLALLALGLLGLGARRRVS
jgi:hypothetical protein